jgi:DNA-damage-inducible protein D
MDQTNDQVPVQSNLSFESLKKQNLHGIEYWSARDLQSCLGYTEWRKFENTIKKAMESCEQSGNAPHHHFVGADKQILD